MRGVGPAGLVHIVCRKHEILSLVPRKPVAHALTCPRRSVKRLARPGDDRCARCVSQTSLTSRVRRWCGQAAGVTVRLSTRHTRCTAVPFMLPRAEEARDFTERPRSEARKHESHAADGLPTCRAQRAILANKSHV